MKMNKWIDLRVLVVLKWRIRVVVMVVTLVAVARCLLGEGQQP